MNRLLFVCVFISLLNSCTITTPDDKPKIRIIEPFIGSPPLLSDYIANFGKTDGSIRFTKAMDDYMAYLKMYSDHIKMKYEIPIDEGCKFKPDFKLLTLPELPNTLSDKQQALDSFFVYVTKVEQVVKNYNQDVLEQIDKFEKCNIL